MLATIYTIHRRTQTQIYDLLHRMATKRAIDGFILPYLGQQDDKLPFRPADMIARDHVMNNPTDFSPMLKDNIALLAGRGEQLTRLLLEIYAPHL